MAAAIVTAPRMAGAAIVLDSTSSARVNGNSTLTFNHTINGGADRLLVVGIAVEEDAFDADVVAVTYNGAAMTKAIDRTVGSTTDMNVELWYMLDVNLPAAGSYPVFIDCPNLAGTSVIMASAISVTGAAQAGPEATASADDGETAATSIQTAITTVTNEAWIFDCVGSGDAHSGFAPDFGQLEKLDVLGQSARLAAGTKEKSTAGLETLGWSMPYSARSAYVLAAFAPAAVAALPPAPGTINYRSIGTDTAVLHSDGDATIAQGTSVVTFGGTANLPANVGLGDQLVIAGSGGVTITREESVVGSGTASPVTLPQIAGGASQTYVLLISTRFNTDITSVTGGGLNWDPEDLNQCSSQGQTGVRIWTAQGSPAAFQAQISYNPAPGDKPIAAVLVRYSGVGSMEDATGHNANGESGACSGGSDTKFPEVTLTSTVNGSVHVVGVNPRRKNIQSADAGYTAVNNVSIGSSFDKTQMHVYDQTFDPAATDTFNCDLNSTEDWAVGGIVLNPDDGSETLHILTRDSATQVTVQETASNAHTNDTYTIKRAYNTMQAWEAARQGDLVAGDRREVGVCYNDGAFTDQLVISGSTTDAGRYMRLTVAEGERHTGLMNTGAVLDATPGYSNGDAITVEDEYTRIEWLEIKGIQDLGDGIYFSAGPSGNNGLVNGVFVHSFWQNNPNAGVNIDAANVTVRNSIMTGGSSIGVRIGAGGSAMVENCTFRGSGASGYGVYTNAGTVGIVNTISVDHVTHYDFYVETAGAANLSYFGYNMYSSVGGGFDPADYQGGNQTPPADLADLFKTPAGDADLHLKTSGHNAVDTGLDLSATSGFSTDIDGPHVPSLAGPARRPEAWDIGADEAFLVEPLYIRYRSIGTNAGILHSTGTATLEAGSSLVTFAGGASLPADVGAGDELVIGSTTYYLHSRDSATQARIQIPPSLFGHYNESYTIKRAYNTLQGWAAGTNQNHFISKFITEGVAYNDGPFTAGVDVQNGLTITGRYRKLTVAEGHRHDGTPGSGVVLDVTPGVGNTVVQVDENAFVFEWFEIKGVHDGQHVIDIKTGGDDGTYRNLLIHDFGGADAGRAMNVQGTGTTIRNVMIYDGDRHGIWVNDNADATIENCTVYGMPYHGINARGLSSVTIRNTISVNNGVSTYAADFNLLGTITYFGYNMFSEATNFDPVACGGCAGNNQVPPADLDDMFISITAGFEDLHLEPAGHAAGNRGTDLSISFTGDVDRHARRDRWDLGADEGVYDVSTPKILSWTEIKP